MNDGFDPEFAAASDWARLYRANGVQVVPARCHLEVKGDQAWKCPLLPSWTEFQNELVSDEMFDRWYGPRGQYVSRLNMGVLTGRCSGNLFVIDLDSYKTPAALAWWNDLMELHNSRLDLETVEQVTGGGGTQKLFRAPVGWTAPTNRTSLGVDIRGQGGFAMLAPSLHESGDTYYWVEGHSPDDLPITMAPDWLLEAVVDLVQKYGRVTAGSGGNGQAGRTSTAQGVDYDAFGHKIDGREEDMYRRIWAALSGLRMDSPIPPSQSDADKVWGEYERHNRARIPLLPGEDNAAALEREGRGRSLFNQKWAYALKKWHDGIKQAAEERAAREQVEGKPEHRIDLVTGQPLPLILTGVDFLKAFKPPDYLVDGIMQRSGLYAVTARTGHGKTAVAMLTAFCVARGVPFHGKPTEQGSVLFFAGENSDDIRARYTVMLDDTKANVADVPLYFIDGVINIQSDMARIRSEAASIPNLSMIIIDTKQAYFLGDDGNSNEQQVQFAKLGRELIKLPGHPSVVFLCHPIKNAGRDNLVPMGGSAFLNEIDFNFTLWAEDKVCKLNPHPDKWRGPAFEELAFELKQQSSARLKDSKGREIPSVIAVPISEMGAERREAVADDDEKQILRLIHADKNASFTRLAERAGWKQPNGELAKSKVARVVARLFESKFVYRFKGTKYRLTKKGCRYVQLSFKDDEDEE